MALSIIKPFVHVEDANGNPYVDAKLYVYLVGTTTLASIYSDDGLSVSLSNPLTGVNGSDAAGNFPRAYIAAGTYKLRAETSAGVLIWQYDNIDTGLSAGSGALPIVSGGTGATTATAARTNLDVPSNSELSALATDITDIQSTLQSLASSPQGRLTLTSLTPVLSTGITAGVAVYYTPAVGNLIPVYDGSQINTETFAELTLTLNSNHTASSIYDVFVFKDTGVITIGTGPAWNTSTASAGARGSGAGTTELNRTIGGFQTNANSMTARNGATTYTVNVNRGTYVGSISIDGTNGQVSCLLAYGQSRKWGVWNAYNRKKIFMKAGDATASWSYVNTAAYRAINGSTANSITVFCGLQEEMVLARFDQYAQVGAGSTGVRSGIGWNSTTAASGFSGRGSTGTNLTDVSLLAEYINVPFIGINVVTALEYGNSATTINYVGGEGTCHLSTQYEG